MSIKTSHILKILRERFHAFPGISESCLVESLQVFRLFDLREGETLRLTGSELPDRLYVALGRVAITNAAGQRREVAANDRGHVLLPPLPAAVTVEALEDSHLCHIDTALADYLVTLEEVAGSLAESGTAHDGYLRLVRRYHPLPAHSSGKRRTGLRQPPRAAGGGGSTTKRGSR